MPFGNFDFKRLFRAFEVKSESGGGPLGRPFKRREPPGRHVFNGTATRYAALPRASAWTSAVVSGLPAIPQSPLSTSSTMHQVT